jgi:hypothetical protein
MGRERGEPPGRQACRDTSLTSRMWIEIGRPGAVRLGCGGLHLVGTFRGLSLVLAPRSGEAVLRG